jgi:hypothetical protein
MILFSWGSFGSAWLLGHASLFARSFEQLISYECLYLVRG